jgi:hypothetical protein
MVEVNSRKPIATILTEFKLRHSIVNPFVKEFPNVKNYKARFGELVGSRF